MAENNQPASTTMPQTGNGHLMTNNPIATGLATAAVVGVGAALIEIEWVPGLLLGVAAMVAPNLVPKIGRGIRPFVRSAIKNGYAATRKTREWMAEASEQVSDMVAEVRSAAMEDESAPAGTGQPAHTAEHGTAATESGSQNPTSQEGTPGAGAPAEA